MRLDKLTLKAQEALKESQQIAERSMHLKKLGLSNEAIARHLSIDGKTVAKSLRWLKDNSSR